MTDFATKLEKSFRRQFVDLMKLSFSYHHGKLTIVYADISTIA